MWGDSIQRAERHKQRINETDKGSRIGDIKIVQDFRFHLVCLSVKRKVGKEHSTTLMEQ